MNATTPKLGFEPVKFSVPLEKLLPIRVVKDPSKNIRRYQTILSSIKRKGVTEPFVVYPQSGGNYLLLDGHLRLHALKELGIGEVDCIAAKDDESFTYNAKINRISPIQEHRMIMKAIRGGVPPAEIAAALHMPVEAVEANATLLDGIDPETVEIIKDKRVFSKCLNVLKRVTRVRQVEMAQLMSAVNNFSEAYAKALLANTPPEFLTEKERRRRMADPKPEEIAQIEQEIESMMTDFKAAEVSLGERILNFSVLKAYIKRLLENAKVVRFLTAKHADLLAQFEEIVATENLNNV